MPDEDRIIQNVAREICELFQQAIITCPKEVMVR
jgi:hypothetical protein